MHTGKHAFTHTNLYTRNYGPCWPRCIVLAIQPVLCCVCCNVPCRLCFTSDLASNAAVPNVSSCKYLNANYSVQAEKPSKILVVVACKNALKKLLTVEATSVSQFDFATVVMARLT